MNARRVHELMRERFPAFAHVEHEWAVVQRVDHVDTEVIRRLLAEHICSPEVLVEVHRKLGASMPIESAPAYIETHVGKGEIRVSDRAFTGFVVVATNGVATGWHHAG